ncbi:ATP-binding protein [Pseudoduganella sp. R-31]|uniref:ATP-binding protein n=1 Tax=unclassified Pseudoduganella TaxID=2637179 RepID=UPI003CF4CB6E
MELDPPIQEQRKERHVVRFYDQDEQLLEEVAEFLDVPLRSGGVSIVIATKEHIAILRRSLAGFGTSANQGPWTMGKLVVLEAELVLDQFMVNDWPDPELFNLSVGTIVRDACHNGRLVHAFGEMVAILCDRGLYEAAIRLEQLWNELQKRFDFLLFCAYPWSVFTSRELLTKFQQVCRVHDHARSNAHGREEAGDVRTLELEQDNRILQSELTRALDAVHTLRHREQELADFVNNAAEGLHRVGSDGTIVWANKAELAMLGYRWEEYVGHHIAEFHVDQELIATILLRLQAGETICDQPAQLLCRSGATKHVLIHSNAYFVDGKLRYTRCFTRDATERMLLQQAYREREDLLSEMTSMNRAKDEFLAMLAHELRNPLAPITAAARTLLSADSDAVRVREVASVVERQAAHLAILLDDLLDVARVTRGQINMVHEPVDLNDVLAAAIEQVTPLFERLSHSLSATATPRQVWVCGDQKRLVQIITNLLTNAAKYTPPGGRIAVRLSVVLREVELVVTDNGIGMAPELVGRVFELFIQGARTSNRSEGGLGVGLALVRRLLHAHGGTIRAESAGPGKGSRFTVKLPILEQHVEQALEVSGDGQHAVGETAGLRVLIVDDNVDAARMLGMLLETAGHRVVLAHTAAEAFQVATNEGPNVCLLDIGLPDMDGRELASRLRQTPAVADAQLIAVSGYGQAEDKRTSLAAGFDHHVVKPVNSEELLALMNRGRAPTQDTVRPQ